MACNWIAYSSDIKDFTFNLLDRTKEIIADDFIGFYIHGSLSMGGFNPKNSDMDFLIVTRDPLTVDTKRTLAKLFLTHSTAPFPVEISFINKEHLENWEHPCIYDFHYSEFWRKRYELDLSNGTYQYLNDDEWKDADLAAHITIINHRGICLDGQPIKQVFPEIPRSHYLSSIMSDFHDCLKNIELDPIYCVLNLIRVYWYIKEGIISSKQEAGNWGASYFPKEFSITVQKAATRYEKGKLHDNFERVELLSFRDNIKKRVEELLNEQI